MPTMKKGARGSLCSSAMNGMAEVGRLHIYMLMLHQKHEHPGGESPQEVVLHLSLDGLLSPNQILAVKPSLQTVTLMATTTDEEPHLLEQQHFSPNGMCVLVPLLEAYPHYCPYEVLLARLFSQTLDQARAQL